MLFHLGALWRLNELGFLSKLSRISSVSGGSITAGLLGLRWGQLGFDNGVAGRYVDEVVAPIRKLASKTIDVEAVLGGVLLPGTVADRVAEAYDDELFDGATLQDLPNDPPRFVINATNVQSGVLWRFMKPYMRDYRVGEVPSPRLSLAVAVAASSAFPPILSPVELTLEESVYSPARGEDLHRPPFTTNVVLTDGGVYDNLGLETAWKRYQTILVSDAGGQMMPEEEPKTDWARHAYRVLGLVDNQVRSLRKRQVIDSLKAKVRTGAYWGIRTDIADYPRVGLPVPHARSREVAEVATRLRSLEPSVQERIINWGYAVSDAALRSHVVVSPPPPAAAFPYPGTGV
jgi:NTE family protein